MLPEPMETLASQFPISTKTRRHSEEEGKRNPYRPVHLVLSFLSSAVLVISYGGSTYRTPERPDRVVRWAREETAGGCQESVFARWGLPAVSGVYLGLFAS